MKTLYLDCGMGAAGDMLTAALLELLPQPRTFVTQLNALGIPGVVWQLEPAEKCGIRGSHMTVLVHGQEEQVHDHHSHEHPHEHEHHHHNHDHGHEHHHHDHGHEHHHHHHDHGHHHHSSLADIRAIVQSLPVSHRVKSDVMAVYELIAQAESHAHGKPVEQIHFHEVGSLDAVADVTAVSLLMELLSPEQVVVSPIHVGSGHVHCAHGILPVPAPATAFLLQDVPIYGGSIRGELCTPTGAALLKHFATRFGDMPVMRTRSIGYGMGKKDFPVANCVRAMLGDTEEPGDTIAQLCCNLDDMTGEALGFATEVLLSAGALDVFTTPIQMKKSRPGVLLTVLCRLEDRGTMTELLFLHTTTLGVRESICSRSVLTRTTREVTTPYGVVRKKIASGFGVTREKAEYDDLARIAREQGLSFQQVLDGLE